MKHLLSTLALMVVLTACTEGPQTRGLARKDAPPYGGTGLAFADAGWKAGDKASWEAHLKLRAQRGQNDYGRGN